MTSYSSKISCLEFTEAQLWGVGEQVSVLLGSGSHGGYGVRRTQIAPLGKCHDGAVLPP